VKGLGARLLLLVSLALLPLLTFAWAIIWFLVRPAITPHQPYASRRLMSAFGTPESIGGVLVSPACGKPPLTSRPVSPAVQPRGPPQVTVASRPSGAQ